MILFINLLGGDDSIVTYFSLLSTVGGLLSLPPLPLLVDLLSNLFGVDARWCPLLVDLPDFKESICT